MELEEARFRGARFLAKGGSLTILFLVALAPLEVSAPDEAPPA